MVHTMFGSCESAYFIQDRRTGKSCARIENVIKSNSLVVD